MTTSTPAAAPPAPADLVPASAQDTTKPPPGTPGFEDALDQARTATAEGQKKDGDATSGDDQTPAPPTVDPTQLLDTLAALTTVPTQVPLTAPAPVPDTTGSGPTSGHPGDEAAQDTVIAQIADVPANAAADTAAVGATTGTDLAQKFDSVTQQGPDVRPDPTVAAGRAADATATATATTVELPALPELPAGDKAQAQSPAQTPAPTQPAGTADVAPSPAQAPPATAAPVSAPAAPATPVAHHASAIHRPEVVPAAQLGATIEKLHDVVQLGSRGGSAHAHLQLHPVELGAVDVRLRTTADGVVATIKVHDAAALGAVTAAGNELRENLTDRGINVARLDVSLSDNGNRQAQSAGGDAQRDGNGNGNSGRGDSATTDIDDIPEEATVALTASGLVDVHA